MNSLSRPWLTMMRLFPSSLAALIFLIVRNVWAGPVEVMRTPDNGIQPQAMVGADGRVHLLYFKGDAAGGDLFYTYRKAQSEGWVAPMRVNRLSGSGLAIGSVRGAQLALGRNGWVHVAWMGSSKAQSVRLEGRDQSPLLYARLRPNASEFEPEQNMLKVAGGLDGGGSLAADAMGHVAVVWHGLIGDAKGEQFRAVYVRESTDDGGVFATEKAVSPHGSGACGCCGIKAGYGDGGSLQVVFRSATQETNRAELVIKGTMDNLPFKVVRSAPWSINNCPMSTSALAQGSTASFAAWETEGQVWWEKFEATGNPSRKMMQPEGGKGGRKHPALAVNSRGEVLLAWTEGTGWQRGGGVAWQLYDKDGKAMQPIERRTGVPVWGLVAVVAASDGNFSLIY